MDMNSIVHNCIHGNDTKKHEKVSRLSDLEEVWADIMRAIDEIVHSVKPRKLILLALDGVAPRAKMNQQRARRFKSAKEADQLKKQLKGQGKEVQDLFDSNQISPGTQFMYELGKQLEWFVKYKLNTDPLYQKVSRPRNYSSFNFVHLDQYLVNTNYSASTCCSQTQACRAKASTK